MKKLVKLGSHYVSDFLKPDEEMREIKPWSLDLYLDEDIGAVRLGGAVPLDKMYGQYWYRSGINLSMVNQLKEIVEEINNRIKLKEGDVWLDIACNDGTMFDFIPNKVEKLGIDPADDTYLKESSSKAKIAQDFFSKEVYYKLTNKKAKVVTCIAMFYDLEDPRTFIKDLYNILDNDGVFVVQMSYTPLMLKQMAFDNICHEHVYYYSLNSLKKLFESEGFILRDCNLNDTNGGSFRAYFQKADSTEKSFGTAQLKDVCDFRINGILHNELINWDISNPEIWKNFEANIYKLKSQVLNFLKEAKDQGYKVYGYGASTKGNTLLQLFGITSDLLPAIAERSPYKFGLCTVGTNIPIISEEEMRAAKPDYLLVLPWHFIDGFIDREKEFLEAGGSLVVPCPKFEIISK